MNSGFIGGARQRLAQLGDACRRVFGTAAQIESGPAKGLRFDAGRDTQQFAAGNYEQPVQEAIVSLVKRGNVCYDIGANLGFVSVLLGRLVGETGKVYAFEPVPRNASIIERNAKHNRLANIEVSRIALSSTDGTADLLLAQHAGGAVLKSVGVPPPDLAGSMAVETAALDTLVERQRLRAPDFIKLDVEGAEMDVLRGMERVLRKWRPVLVVEIDDALKQNCEDKLAECRTFLHDLGYGTRLIPNAYKDGTWFVRHFIAEHEQGAAGSSGR